MSSPAAAGDPATDITDRVARTLRAALPPGAARLRARGDIGPGWARTTLEFDDGAGTFRRFALDRVPAYETAAVTGDMMALHELHAGAWQSFVVTVDRNGCVTIDYS
ncbi:hypothetical protein [Nocardia sp. NPDC048505]|uniref:hypothetical protein n=1 Tax=unclassified Nocardia TaxID=2637762 RepID=UPI0033FFC08E